MATLVGQYHSPAGYTTSVKHVIAGSNTASQSASFTANSDSNVVMRTAGGEEQKGAMTRFLMVQMSSVRSTNNME